MSSTSIKPTRKWKKTKVRYHICCYTDNTGNSGKLHKQSYQTRAMACKVARLLLSRNKKLFGCSVLVDWINPAKNLRKSGSWIQELDWIGRHSSKNYGLYITSNHMLWSAWRFGKRKLGSWS